MPGVGAIILAAGGSRRLGSPKALLKIADVSFVRRIVDAADDGGCQWIAVVAGEASGEIALELTDTRAELVQHRDWERGIGSSIRVGVTYLLGKLPMPERFLLLTCDQPFVNAKLISQLLGLDAPIVACSYADTIGIPAIFSRSYAVELQGLADDAGAKYLLQRNPATVVTIPFEDGAIDIDTANDYQALLAARRGE